MNIIYAPPPRLTAITNIKSSLIRHHRVLEKSSLRRTVMVHQLPNSWQHFGFLQHRILIPRSSGVWRYAAWYKLMTFLGISSLPPQDWLNWSWSLYVGPFVPDYTASQATIISRSQFHKDSSNCPYKWPQTCNNSRCFQWYPSQIN